MDEETRKLLEKYGTDSQLEKKGLRKGLSAAGDVLKKGGKRLGNWFSSVRNKLKESREGRRALKKMKMPSLTEYEIPFFKKLLFVALAGIGSFLLYSSGLNFWWCLTVFLAFSILILSKRTTSKNILNIVLTIILLTALIYLLVMFFPLIQTYREQSGGRFWRKAESGVSDFVKNTHTAISSYVETQIECATGNCPRGEAEGEYVGMTISQPQLLIPEREYGENEVVTVFSDVEGINLRIYNDITATPACTIEAKKGRDIVVGEAKEIQPPEIPFIDISNKKRTIRCAFETIPTKTYLNKINITLTFPFSTTSDLKIYVMNENRRNLMMEMWGDDFLYTYYQQELEPIAKFNDGPVNLGISVNQIPLAVGKSETPAEISFALFSQWGYYGGEISKINDIKIEVPEEIEIFTTEEITDFCPFEKSGGNVYSLKKDFITKYPIKTVRSFICGIKIKNVPDQSFDLWIPHIRITADYEYVMRGELELYLKQPEKKEPEESGKDEGESDSGGGSGGGMGSYLSWPVEYSMKKVVSCYGDRPSLGDYHRGIDLSNSLSNENSDEGKPVYAAAEGSVSIIDFDDSPHGYGNWIEIKHSDNTRTRYAHLKETDVKVGDKVSAGERIGSVGSTGYSTGPHLHFEFIDASGEKVNPLCHMEYDNSQLIGDNCEDSKLENIRC